jgi:hypothetical protein
MKIITSNNFEKEAKKKKKKWDPNPWAICETSVGKKENPKKFEKCCLPGTLITLEDGSNKSIEEIQEGDMVLTHKGRAKKVIKKIINKVQENIYEIETYGNFAKLNVTGEHPILAMPILSTWKSGKASTYSNDVNFIETKKLKIGDAIHTPSYGIYETSLNIDEDTAFMMGVYAAEGNIEGTMKLKDEWYCGHNRMSKRIKKDTD